MSKTIWKYPVTCDRWVQMMPIYAEILSVQVQNTSPEEAQMWVLVDPNNPHEPREFEAYGTGYSMPSNPGKFIGTFQLEDGASVFHLFECELTAQV